MRSGATLHLHPFILPTRGVGWHSCGITHTIGFFSLHQTLSYLSTSGTIADTALHFPHSSFILIVIVRSTPMVDSQGCSPFSLRYLVCSVFPQAIYYFFTISYYHSIQYFHNNKPSVSRANLHSSQPHTTQNPFSKPQTPKQPLKPPKYSTIHIVQQALKPLHLTC